MSRQEKTTLNTQILSHPWRRGGETVGDYCGFVASMQAVTKDTKLHDGQHVGYAPRNETNSFIPVC